MYYRVAIQVDPSTSSLILPAPALPCRETENLSIPYMCSTLQQKEHFVNVLATLPLWQWKSTALSELSALFQWLRLYHVLPHDHLQCSHPAHVKNGNEVQKRSRPNRAMF